MKVEIWENTVVDIISSSAEWVPVLNLEVREGSGALFAYHQWLKVSVGGEDRG